MPRNENHTPAAAGHAGMPFGQCIVTVEFHYAIRRRHDWDNMAGELKGLMDGLSRIIWADDNTDCILELRMKHVTGTRDGLLFIVEPLLVALI